MCITKEQYEQLKEEMHLIKLSCEHNDPSAKTMLMFDSLNSTMKEVLEKLDKIYPYVSTEMDRSHAYSIVKGDVKGLTGFGKWLVATIVTFGFLSGYFQNIVKLWLGIK